MCLARYGYMELRRARRWHCWARKADALAKAKAESGQGCGQGEVIKIEAYSCDVPLPRPSTRRPGRRSCAEFGKADIVVNNPRISHAKPFEK